MGGNISVESTPGEGSVFTVEIPAVNNDSLSSENTDDDTADEPLEIVEGTHPVLYIEDNLSNLRLMKQALSKLDYVQLISAEEPHEGLRLAELHRPELILLDLNLPGMDGYEVLQKIRESDWGRSIPVVAVTANAMQKDIEKGMEAGFNDYLTKPLNISRLYNLIDSLLSPKK
jgi:CheY-like chemotaxis protein